MKKLSFLLGSLLLITACKDDDDSTDVNNNDNVITVAAEQNALLMLGYTNNTEASVSFHRVRLIAEDLYEDNLDHISVVDSSIGDLGQTAGDSMVLFFGFAGPPTFKIGAEDVDPDKPITEPEFIIAKKPLANVNQRITENDTAWVVDAKVKFFKDTIGGANIKIQTYLLGNIEARKNDAKNFDVTQAGTQQVITNDNKTVWNESVLNIDSSATLAEKGDIYVHQYVLLKKFNVTPVGRALDTYWPFGSSYIANDVIGTADTPIRHYFLKDDQLGVRFPPYDFEPEFLTVLWIQNPVSGSWEYLNSVQSGL